MFTSVARIALIAALPFLAQPQGVFAQEANGGFRLDLGTAPDESRQEARDSEALLLPEERLELQSALQWYGFYAGSIDGDYGPGTRKSMSAWQEYQGVDPTGFLTTRQRTALLDAYHGEIATYGFASVTDDKAGITVTLPLNLVEFDHYEPPFAHYKAKAADAPQIVLISQPGDQAAFFGLYDILQSLKSVPLEGERERGEKSFHITGTSADTATTVQAQLNGGPDPPGACLISAAPAAGSAAAVASGELRGLLSSPPLPSSGWGRGFTCHRGALWRAAWPSSCVRVWLGPIRAMAEPALTPARNRGAARTSMCCSAS